MESVYHIPALLPQALDALDIHPGGVYIDCTFGGGGHSRAIVDRLDAQGHLYGFDQDRDARANAIDDPRFTFVLSNFRFLSNFMRFYGVDSVDGVLADLGVSFHHFDDEGRGFSFRFPEGPLDMRMNRAGRLTAAEVVNNYDVERLGRIFKLYGEMSQGPRIARAINKARSVKPIATTADLLAVVEPFINPRQYKKELAQLFQALRIEVNDEIGALRAMLTQALAVLRPGGRLVVITYHSLEDRLVKNFMRTGNVDGKDERDFFGRSLAPMRLLTAKPVVADEAEVLANPRSRAAKLRAAVKLKPPVQSNL